LTRFNEVTVGASALDRKLMAQQGGMSAMIA